jgi:hypothetical protein
VAVISEVFEPILGCFWDPMETPENSSKQGSFDLKDRKNIGIGKV